jgi:hypothetical protein
MWWQIFGTRHGKGKCNIIKVLVLLLFELKIYIDLLLLLFIVH